jgi:hypothetical protein
VEVVDDDQVVLGQSGEDDLFERLLDGERIAGSQRLDEGTDRQEAAAGLCVQGARDRGPAHSVRAPEVEQVPDFQAAGQPRERALL